MQKKCYKEFEKLVEYKLNEVCLEFKIYTYKIKKEVLEDRASKGSSAGYENEAVVRNFEKVINEKLDVILAYISNQFDKLNRKLSNKQKRQLSEMVLSHFKSMIYQFENELINIIDEVSEMIKSEINSMTANIKDQIYNYFAVMNFTRKFYYDKYFFGTVFSTGVSVASMIISVLIWIFEV